MADVDFPPAMIVKRPIQHYTIDVCLIEESVFSFCLGMSYGYVSVSWLLGPDPGYPVK